MPRQLLDAAQPPNPRPMDILCARCQDSDTHYECQTCNFRFCFSCSANCWGCRGCFCLECRSDHTCTAPRRPRPWEQVSSGIPLTPPPPGSHPPGFVPRRAAERISVLEECRLYGLLPAVRQSAARGRWSYLVDRLLSSQRRLMRGDIQHNRLKWRRMVWCLISYKDNDFRCWQTNLFRGSHSAMRQLCAPPGAKLEESRRQAQAPVRIANEF